MATKAQTKKPSTKVKAYTPEQFAKLANATQKRLILEDAIAQLKAKKFKAAPGTYARINGIDIKKLNGEKGGFNSVYFNGSDARDLINNSGTCEVCAIGSLFMSAARVGDGCPMEQYGYAESDYWNSSLAIMEFDEDSVFQKLEKYFGDNIYVMETAFEDRVINEDGFARYLGFEDQKEALDSYNEESYKYHQLAAECCAFYKKYHSSATNRLIAILENTLRNKLVFTPARTELIVNP